MAFVPGNAWAKARVQDCLATDARRDQSCGAAMSERTRILVVDDNATNLELLARLLRGKGYEVSEAGSGAQCLELVRRQAFDLVLMDVVMPDLGGVEVCQRLKADPTQADMFVVLISSQEVSPENKAAGLDCGADEYIVRPVPARELLARMNALVRIQQARKELRLARAELEIRVTERTAQLTRANEDLRQEIVERKRAEHELRQKENQLQSAHQLAQLGSWRWEIATGEVVWSDETYRIFGLEPGKFMPGYEAFFNMVFPEDRERVQRAVQQSLDSHEPYSADYRLRRPDGSTRFIHGHGEVVLDTAGRVVVMQGVNQDITDRKLAEEALRDLPRRIIEAQENERRRVARELHDGVNQILSSVRFRIQAVESHLLDTDRGLVRDVTKAKGLLERALQEVRRISENLRPSELDELGLAAAINGTCGEFKERTGIAMEVHCLRVPKNLSAELKLTVYRMVQEALNNIEKHADARHVVVRLASDRGWLRLSITDDGTGFKPRTERERKGRNGGFGLLNMRERAMLSGGTFDLQSKPGDGTTISFRAPVSAAHKS